MSGQIGGSINRKQKQFDIKKEHEKAKKSKTSHPAGSYQKKENVYDLLNESMEVHGQSEEEKDIFED